MRSTLNHSSILALLALSACSAPTRDPEPTSAAASPAKPVDPRQWLQEFGAAYGYDTGYLERLLELSPAAYESFALAMQMSEHRVRLPIDAHYVGCISALMADDCGACVQLNLKMAVEAGVDRALLRRLLEHSAELPEPLGLVRSYADRVAKGQNADPETIAALRRSYGDEAFGELAINVLGCRIYPALRRAMGAESACPPPSLDFD